PPPPQHSATKSPYYPGPEYHPEPQANQEPQQAPPATALQLQPPEGELYPQLHQPPAHSQAPPLANAQATPATHDQPASNQVALANIPPKSAQHHVPMHQQLTEHLQAQISARGDALDGRPAA